MRLSFAWAAVAACTCLASTPTAWAQSAEDEGTHQEEAVDPSAAEQPEEGSEVDFRWTGGFNLATGNARSFAANSSLLFNYKSGPHVFDAQALANLGYAVTEDSMSSDILDNQNALNVIGRLRYDYFFTDDDAIFAAVWGRHDPFANLDFRFQGQVGYLRNLYRTENLRIWGEIGYDATIDWQAPEDPDNTNPVDQHSGRLFLGYDNQVNEVLTYRTGVEGLFDFTGPESGENYNFRLFWTNALGSKVNDVLTLALTFVLIFDNQPVPGAQDLDTITAFSFVLDII